MKPTTPIHFYLTVLIVILAASCREEQETYSDSVNEQVTSINIVNEGAINWENKEPCKIIYSDNIKKVELPAKIKCRGGASSRYYKHSYALELNDKYPLGNLPHDDDWILNANYIDKTFMRHKISYDLFKEMNPVKNMAASSSYVTLSINDIYQGLYVLMQEINGSLIGLDKGDSLAMLFKDPPIFYKEKSAYVQDPLNYYQQKYPDIDQIDHAIYIERFKDFLFNSTDSDFATNVSTWVDVDNVIDWHIMLLFTNNSDGIMKNFYLYKLNASTPFRFAIWDYDHSYGRDGDNELNLMENELNCNRSILLDRLTHNPETGYLPKLKKRWNTLRNRQLISVEHFKTLIVQNDKVISKEIDNNAQIWPVDDEWYYDNNDYKQEIDIMLKFAEIRIAQLDNYFNSL